MTITINGAKHEFPDRTTLTVSDLIKALELGPQPLLVELNGIALYPREFAETTIPDDAKVEIIRMVAGG